MKKFLVVLVCFLGALFLSADKSVFNKNSSNDVFRVDVAGVNDVRSINVSANGVVDTQYPGWCKDCSVSVGKFDENKSGEAITWSISASRNDQVTIKLLGPNAAHVPVYVVYRNLVVDGNPVVDKPVRAWHDQPYSYTVKMKARQKLEFSVVPEKAGMSSYWQTLRIKWFRLILYFCCLMVLYVVFLKFSKKKVK